MLLMRIALGVEYDGSQFYGWQRQIDDNTIQQTIEHAISKVADTEIAVQAAGRTDTGVHATEQVLHFDCDRQRDLKAWVMGVNTHLPHSVSILWAQEMQDDFHARFSAESRRYRYVILNRDTRPALMHKKVTWVFQSLNVANMQQAAMSLLGRHDFTSYRAVACQAKSPVRTMHQIKITQHNQLILIDLHADGFLHHMVRNIAGVLISIGKGDQDVSWSKEVLEKQDRSLGGVTASAGGLYLVKVHYADKFNLDAAIRWPLNLLD